MTNRTDAFVENRGLHFHLVYMHYLSVVSGEDMVVILSFGVLQFLSVLSAEFANV